MVQIVNWLNNQINNNINNDAIFKRRKERGYITSYLNSYENSLGSCYFQFTDEEMDFMKVKWSYMTLKASSRFRISLKRKRK